MTRTVAAQLQAGGLGLTITSAVAARIREDIRAGRLAPGARLRQTNLAREYKVSTTPVREAFMVLEREGLVTREDHRGVVVFEPTLEDLRETYEIRIPLECTATEKAVPNLTEDDLAAMDTLLRLSEQAHRALDVTSATAVNEQFHSTLYRACAMPRLIALIDNLRVASSAYMKLANVLQPVRAESEHREILAACRARDPERAALAVRLHLGRTVAVIVEGIQKTALTAETGEK
jgi:DNA-binding GntR family transcriptional regulator